MQVICAVILVPVLIAVGVLMTWHLFLLLHNKTTIEVLNSKASLVVCVDFLAYWEYSFVTKNLWRAYSYLTTEMLSSTEAYLIDADLTDNLFDSFECGLSIWGRSLCWQYHEGVRAKWLAEKAGHRYRHPYNVGVYTNLVTVSYSIFFPQKHWIICDRDQFIRISLILSSYLFVRILSHCIVYFRVL